MIEQKFSENQILWYGILFIAGEKKRNMKIRIQ